MKTKKMLTKALSVFLVVVMTLTAAPLSGFVGLELPDWLDFSIMSSAAIYTGTCGENVTWSFDESTGTLTISGTGAMDDYSYNNSPWESYKDSIKTVVIKNGITTIGDNVFWGSNSLTSVTIGDSVTTIGNYAFAWCDSLTRITVENNNQYYTSNEDGVLFNKDKTILIQYPVGNTRTNYTIPDSVTTISNIAFARCNSLTRITVENNNQYYSSDEYGVLYNKDKTKLIQYPIGNTRTSYTIPNSVTTICDGAFAYCDSLTSVTISDCVTVVGRWTFFLCTSLTSVTIPDSVTSIGFEAFYYCTRLTDVYYSGTEEQWNAITIDSNNDSLLNATNHYESEFLKSGTVVGYLEDYYEYILEAGVPTYVCEITVDGVSYDVSSYVLMTSEAETLIGKKIILVIKNNVVVDVCEYSSLTTDLVVIPNNFTLYYENGKFPDKKIDITGSVYNELNNKMIDASVVASNSSLQLNNISVTLISNNQDIIYFKDGVFSSKTNTKTFGMESISAGYGMSFAQTAKVNTKWDFPVELAETSFDITCTVTGTINGYYVSDTKTISVTLINNDYDIRNTWRTQSLEDLINQMEEQVNACPVLTSGEKAQVSLTFTAIKMSQDLLKINDDLEALDCIYDLSCYVYGLKNATVRDAGKMLMETIQAECYDASDDLKTELANLLESLTETKEFNKFAYWYYNQQQVYNRNAKQVNAHCPIDITVTDEDGFVVLSIENDEVVVSEEGAAGFVCDGQKTIYLPTDINHSITITATANGTMDYSVMEMKNDTELRVVEYYEIALSDKTYLIGDISKELLPVAEEYNLVKNDGETIEYDSINSKPIESPKYNYTFSIQTPSTTTIRHKDGIKLHANIEGTAPAGSYVEWTASNGKFKTEEINDGNSLKIVSDSNGKTTFTATLYSADGEVLATDTIEMKSKAGFFDKFGSFFRSLFGSTKIYEY